VTNPYRRHVSGELLSRWLTETPDLNADGSPVINPRTGEPTVTRTFSGTCGHCGEPYWTGAASPYHYVCPSLPSEADPRMHFVVTACHESCAIDCGPPRQ
jgi:hypothetical protein